MKKFLLLILLIPFSASAITWTYFVTENGKAGPKIKLGKDARNFKLKDRTCTADETVVRTEGEETKALVCDVTATSRVMTTANCTEINKVMKSRNLGDLSFIVDKDVISVILYCE